MIEFRLSKELLDTKTVFQEQLNMSKRNLLEILDAYYARKKEGSGGDSNEFLQLSSNALLDADWGRMLEQFCSSCKLEGGKHRIWEIIGNPGEVSYRQRQSLQQSIREGDLTLDLTAFQRVESDILWVLGLHGRIDYPLSLLYPTLPLLRKVNHHDIGLTMLHLYKILGAPLMQLSMPVMTLIAPYFFLRRQMGPSLTLKMYTRMLWLIGKLSLKQLLRKLQTRAGLRALSSIVTVLVYLVMHLYSVVNTIEMSLTTVRALRTLKARAQRIRAFLKTVGAGTGAGAAASWRMMSPIGGGNLPDPTKDSDLVFLYKLMQSHQGLAELADRYYAEDAVHAIRARMQQGWTFIETATSLGAPPVSFVGMGHPLLDGDGVRNPVQLDKNIVITGPNAAGKSTYMRAVLLNTLLGVTLGICCAKKGILGPIQAIHTQMRLVDSAGQNSLFEAEVHSCKSLLEGIYRSRPWSLVFLDEPMHSTNALEGASALKGLVERLSQIAGTRCMVTTHYHDVGDLKCVRPLCMEAQQAVGGGGGDFTFSYKLRPGVSRQSIALELLRKAVDDPFIDLAIQHKNRV